MSREWLSGTGVYTSLWRSDKELNDGLSIQSGQEICHFFGSAIDNLEFIVQIIWKG